MAKQYYCFQLLQYQEKQPSPQLLAVSNTHKMLQRHFHNSQRQPQNLILTFRKFIVKQGNLDNNKVTVVVTLSGNTHRSASNLMKIRKNYEISQPRPVKNGLACFYGESIIITEKVRAFTVTVIGVGEEEDHYTKASTRVLAKMEIGDEEIREVEKKKCSFSTGTEAVELIWQAKFQYQNYSRNQEQNDRSMDEDFNDIIETNFVDVQNEIIGRKIYSPAVKGQARKKTSSFRLKKDDSRVQLVSESPHKLTMDTTETIANLKKRVKLMSPAKNKNQLKEFRREKYYDAKPEVIEKQPHQKLQQKAPLINSVISPKITTSQNKFSYATLKQPMTPQHGMKSSQHLIPKKRERFYERINLKSLLYTSMIGIIGGMAATQF